MEHGRTSRASCVLLTALLFGAPLLAGCGGRPLFGPVGARARSYAYKDERVEVRMLTLGDLRSAPMGVTQAQWNEHLKEVLPGLPPEFQAQSALAPTALIGTVLGYAIDQLKLQLQREAELYEAQFSAVRYDTGFWTIDAGSARQNLWGIEIVRYAKGFDPPNASGEVAAFRFICAIAPANALKVGHGGSPADPKIFALVPLFLQTNAAKAKVLFTGSRIDTRVNLAIDATWVAPNQAVHQERVAVGDFEYKAYKLAAEGLYPVEDERPVAGARVQVKPVLIDGDFAGWFGGLPFSFEGTAARNCGFKVTVVVTERDQSQAKQVFERVAKYVEDHKADVIERVTGGGGTGPTALPPAAAGPGSATDPKATAAPSTAPR